MIPWLPAADPLQERIRKLQHLDGWRGAPPRCPPQWTEWQHFVILDGTRGILLNFNLHAEEPAATRVLALSTDGHRWQGGIEAVEATFRPKGGRQHPKNRIRRTQEFCMAFRGILALLLFGCGNDVSITKQRIDDDSDGYFQDADCDDHHASVHPDASELCDGLDNDCDNTVDEDASDAPMWFVDADGDGWGDEDVSSCSQPDGSS